MREDDVDGLLLGLLVFVVVVMTVSLVMIALVIPMQRDWQLLQLEQQACAQGVPDCTSYGPYGHR